MLFWSSLFAASPSPVASGLGAAVGSKGEKFLPWSFLIHILMPDNLGGCHGPSCSLFPCPWLCPSPPLPLQMWTSAWRAPTAATSTPSARTPRNPTSASASPATPAMGSTAKVGARRRWSPSNEPQAIGEGCSYTPAWCKPLIPLFCPKQAWFLDAVWGQRSD